jgi:hypothetical protein
MPNNPIVYDSYIWDKMVAAVDGHRDSLGHPKVTLMQAIGASIGLKWQEYPADTRAYQLHMEFKRMQDEVDMLNKGFGRDAGVRNSKTWEEANKRIQHKNENLIEKAKEVGEEMPAGR